MNLIQSFSKKISVYKHVHQSPGHVYPITECVYEGILAKNSFYLYYLHMTILLHTVFFVLKVMYKNTLHIQEKVSKLFLKIFFKTLSLHTNSKSHSEYQIHLFHVLLETQRCTFEKKNMLRSEMFNVLFFTKQTQNRHHQNSGWKFPPTKHIFLFTHKEREAPSITESICRARARHILASSEASEMKEESKS